ncbi:vWA domain-containing protein [Streptomyces sp. cmx-18-6]|uniref:vWA domain-containing protein n=1 Tax=Streptomyces sp. cmx-18-6 TaxID=2790930 RepID=UPI0039815B95
MARNHRRTATAGAWIGGVIVALVAGALPAAAASPLAPGNESAGRAGSLVMVLDSSGSMADDDGAGRTRMESARTAVGAVVDALPDGYPTGLRVYGADRTTGCTDTRLVRPVEALDRDAVKQAVDRVRPKGDTPIGLSLQKAADDLPEPSGGAVGTRTILLISDGEDNCGTPQPCQVAEQLTKAGVGLRIDTVGFQVKGAAREQLECVAAAGNGRYYDAPDAAALARQLQRAAQLSADGYRFRGKPVTGGMSRDQAPDLRPGQYLDTIGPGEERYYAADLDDVSTVNFAATAVPQPGAAIDEFDALRTKIVTADGLSCEMSAERFHQKEGAAPLTSAVARVRSDRGERPCDRAGRYWLVVERESKKGSDASRWPLEMVYGAEAPLAEGVTPAQSSPEYGAGGKEARLPTGSPRDVRGGTGFNDATPIGGGVWKDTVLPSQTLWYKVPAGWGQQVRYDVEFANEPTLERGASTYSYGATQLFTPARFPISGGGVEFTPRTMYNGRPAVIRMGSVPVAWTNRYEIRPTVRPVHADGDFYLAVTLGARAAEIAENPRIGVVLRVAVLGDELAGPQHGAPVLGERGDGGADGRESGDADGRAGGPAGGEAKNADDRDNLPVAGDSSGAGGAGWTGIAAAAGAGALVIVAGGLLFVRSRRRAATGTMRGSA